MSKYHSFYDTVDHIVTYGIEKNILHLFTDEQQIDGTSLMINEKRVINFGSCSYLGLEFNQRIKAASILAIRKYGTQFSASRAYISLGLYKKLQELLQNIFNAYCVITPTTTLGHTACIPIIADEEDLIILDQQVHNSVQTATQLLKARGIPVELLRHNRMDLLEERIKELRGKHKKIWYMADGIYSMFGDCCPVKKIYELLDRYPEFYFYVDDAHGMSLHGKNGQGFILNNRDIHAKMIMATSLNKAFASGGGVLVFGDKELGRKVGTVGGPLLSSGPMQPSGLGAAIASAQIHLSGEIRTMQEELHDKIKFTSLQLAKYGLPIISKPGGAIFFVGVSLPKLGHNLVKRMLQSGYYVNLGVFPTVPLKQTGIRFTITRLHSFNEIENMIATLATHFPRAMKEEGITLPEIYKAFKIPMPEQVALHQSVNSLIQQTLELQVEHHKSIDQVDQQSWDLMFKNKGTFDVSGLRLLEKSFNGNSNPQDNWEFDYLVIKQMDGTPVAASFFTTALWKDDMLSPAIVSSQIEEKRKTDPYFLTSKVICSGSLITEGEHLYTNTASALWPEAIRRIISKVYELQDLYKANQIVFRDFKNPIQDLDDLMIENGFFKCNMPNTHTIELQGNRLNDFFEILSAKSKNHLRTKVLKKSAHFKVKVVERTGEIKRISKWYSLYLNVKNKNLELNTFSLPFTLFNQMANDPHWEAIELYLCTEQVHEHLCAMIICYKTPTSYIPMIIGLDYQYNQQYDIYRQALYQVIIRAQKLDLLKIRLGFSASVEKRKLGAKSFPVFAYVHSRDTFNAEVLSSFSLMKDIT